MPGLIDDRVQPQTQAQRMNNTDVRASGGSSTSYTPERITVNEDQDTVQGRIQAVINQNSPLMQGARTRAKQESNKRGILNSTMGVQAGEEATYNYALPIAQQDAATFYNARTLNQAAGNEASQFNVGHQQNIERDRLNTDNESRLIGERGDIESRQIGERGDVESGLITDRGDQSSRLQSEAGDIESRQIGERTDAQSRLQGEAGDIESRQIGERGDVQSGLQAEAGEIESGLIGDRTQADLALQEARTQGAKELADLEGKWRNVLNTNETATNMYNTFSEMVGNILADGNIKSQNKQGLIDQLRTNLDNGLEVISTVSGLDLTGVLDFSTSTGIPGDVGGEASPYYNPRPQVTQ